MRQPSRRLLQLTLIILVMISTACSTASVSLLDPAATATATPLPLPPTIAETVPQMGSELGPKSTLLVFFSEPMDRVSVEDALTSNLPGGPLLSWVDDTTLGITPKSAAPANGQITFNLAASAKGVNGLAMSDALTLSYKVAGPLRVSQVLPAPGAIDISPDSAVVVTFNQPVVALGSEDSSSLPAALTLEPAAQGKGEWLNTSTYIFHPAPALSGGADYNVHINPQLSATNGVALDPSSNNMTWNFRTSLPRLLEVFPVDSAGPLPIDPELKLTFNQPMDRASVEANLTLTGPDGKLAGSFAWNEKSTVATFKPAALLQRSTAYTLSLSGQTRSSSGATLGSDSNYNYQSVAPFGVLSTPFANGTTHPAGKNVSFTFTAPFADYKPSEIDALVTVSPGTEYQGTYVDGQTINITNSFIPGQHYTVTISGKLRDRWGQELGQDYVFSFNQRDADPSIGVGSYYTSMLFSRPEAPQVSVQAVNISQLHVFLGSFPLSDFFNYQSNFDYEKTYSASEIESWNELLDPTANQNKAYMIDLSRDGKRPPMAPGLYYVQVSSKEVAQSRQTAIPLLISNVNLTLKTSGKQAFVWATDLRTQAPLANIAVILYDQKGIRQASGTTNANGIWQGEMPDEAAEKNIYAVTAQPGDDLFGMAAENWNAEINAFNFGLNGGGSTTKPAAYLYTERPVYRPGDVVHYRGILRNLYNGRYTSMGMNSISILFNDPNGVRTEGAATISSYGTFNGEFTLSANATPGYYNMEINDADKKYISSVAFQVADYRKPEINLSAALSPNPAINGQGLTGTVNAAYFFGAPVNDLPFEWHLYKAAAYFDLPGYATGLYRTDWYGFNGYGYGGFGEQVASGKSRTGPDGSFSIALDHLHVEDTTNLTLEITATESGGFPVSARATIPLHPADFYVGIRPVSWFGRAGSELSFDALTVDLDKKAVPGKALTASFQKVDWQRTDLLYSYNFTPTYTPVDSKQTTSDASGKAHVAFTPAEPGTYMLELAGDGTKSQVLIWVSGAQNAALPEMPYQRMELTADQSKYKPGDTANIFIPGTFKDPALALITTERSSVLTSTVVSVPPEGYTFTLPLTDDQAPNTYVSVTMLGPNADFRQGYVNLPVEPSAFKLNVDLKATPEKAKPGDELTLDLTVTDSKGQPVQGEFSMAVVDLAALALAEPNAQAILPAFYDIQPLGVNTALTDAIYARRGLPLPPGGKGGGGGGDILTLREKFPDTAYWKADIITDAQGKAQIKLTLPDSLTTWQVDTRGLTQDTKVGQAVVQVVTSKELLIRPQTPRFLVVGDQTELAAIVNNNTASELTATVSLQATGFSLTDPTTVEQKVQVPANGRIRVAWSGTIKAEDVVKSIFTVKAGSLSDSARPNDGDIPVLHYSAPQTFSTAGVLSDAASRLEILALPKSFKPLGGKLDVELSPSLASVILDTIQADTSTSDDINWNNERLVSHFWPQLETSLTMKAAGLSNEPLSDALAVDIRHLMANQNPIDHGWAWTTGYNEPSDPYLSAYILLALTKVAKTTDLGIKVDDTINNGVGYLLGAVLDTQTHFDEPWALNRAAYQDYVLQQAGGVNIDILNTLYDKRDKLSPWAKALLADTLLTRLAGDERGKTLFSDLQSNAIRSATGVHWESPSDDGRNPNSPLLTTAIVVYTLAQHDPANPILADAVRYLASQRGATARWGSSYEATWVILALNQYMKGTGELQGSFNFSAALNGAPFASGAEKLKTVTATAPLEKMYTTSANSLLISREAGAGKLYYRAALSIDRPVESAPPLNNGITVSRKFLTCSGADCVPVTSFQMPADSSGRVKVQVTVTIPNDSYYLMVQDNVPAGADILDSSLKTSQQGEQIQFVEQEATPTPQGPQYDNANPFSAGWGWWYFNQAQIYSDHILWSADYLPAGTYVLTYTIVPSLPGAYRVLPAHAWQAYFPEVQGTSAGAVFEIKAK